jgi:hypothetical protein
MAISLSSLEIVLVARNWACGRDKTHCQKLDDPFNPLGEDHSPVLSVAGIVAADIVVRRATCMSAEGDVLI